MLAAPTIVHCACVCFLFSSSSCVLSFWMIHHFSLNVYIRRRNDLRFHLKCWIPNGFSAVVNTGATATIHLSYCFRNRKIYFKFKRKFKRILHFVIVKTLAKFRIQKMFRCSTQCCHSILNIFEIHFNYWTPKIARKHLMLIV